METIQAKGSTAGLNRLAYVIEGGAVAISKFAQKTAAYRFFNGITTDCTIAGVFVLY